jgi:hypothetical protein
LVLAFALLPLGIGLSWNEVRENQRASAGALFQAISYC